ncbi:hypothetical protein ACOMHN_017610 [Nucella lapillus]
MSHPSTFHPPKQPEIFVFPVSTPQLLVQTRSNVVDRKTTQIFYPSFSYVILKVAILQDLKVGLTPQGVVVDRVYVLVVSASSPSHHLPLPGLPPSPCRSFHQVSASSTSHKVRSYPELVRDYKQLRRSKSGMMEVFEMLPGEKGCRVEDVSTPVLSRMIGLGEFLSRRYQEALPQLQDRGRDPVVAGSVPELPPFQSVSALLHGLLGEKQFCRMEVRKLERHAVRGVSTHQPCPVIAQIEPFMERAYAQEKGIFKDQDFTGQGPQPLYRSLGVGRSTAAKDVVTSLHHRACDIDRDLCGEGRCLNLTEGDVGHLWEAISQHNAYLSSSSVFQSYAAVDTARHMETLFSWFSQTGTPADKVLKVDMADDYFFLKLLSTLGHRLQNPILPSTRLVIEQFRKAHSQGPARFWRVLVDGEVVTDGLLSCVGGAAKGLCGVDTLKAHLQHSARHNMFGTCFETKDEL